MKRLFLLLALVAVALPALASDDWTEVRSPHVIVLTGTGLSSGRAVALRIERMRSVMAVLLQKEEIRSGVPLQVIAFKDTRQMQPALPLWRGKPTPGAALVRSTDIDYLLLDLSNPDAYGLVWHDYAHALLDANTAPMPLWYDEGVAEFFSSVLIGDKEFTIGHLPLYYDDLLRAHQLMPTAHFLAITRTSPEYTENADRHSLYYAQAWLMISWALANHRIIAVNEYAARIVMQHAAPADAFQQAFGMTPAAFDQELARYLAAGPKQTYLPIPAGMDDVGTYAYANRPVHLRDVQVTIADFHLHTQQYFEQGIAELRTVLQTDPDNAGANRSLGYAALEKGDFAKAAELLKQSIDYTSGDPRPYYYMAFVTGKSKDVQGGGSASFAMKSNLLKALDLDPSYADAWSLLALVFDLDGKVPEATADMLKAISLAPRNDRNRFQLARFYAQAKRWDDSRALLDYLKNSSDPEVAADVAKATEQLEAAKTAPPHAARLDERPRPSTYDDPKWQLPDSIKQRDAEEDAREARGETPDKPAAIDKRPVLFLKGTLVSATCAPSGNATLTVYAGKKKLQLSTPDYKKLVLIGAGSFSCDWKDRSVSVNYRASSATTGDLVSLEVE